jgi:hypothetical protein
MNTVKIFHQYEIIKLCYVFLHGEWHKVSLLANLEGCEIGDEFFVFYIMPVWYGVVWYGKVWYGLQR